MAAAETARLIASLELQDKNFTRGLRNVEKGVNRVDRKLGAFSGAINRNVGRAVDNLISRGIDAGQAVIQAAIDQESAITGIRKTLGDDIDGIVKDLKRLSTETGSTFEELAGIAELGGAMGIAKDDISAFTEQVAILGATTDVSVEDAATALGQLQNVIGLTGDEFDNFAASLVDLGNKGASTESAILEIAKRSGGAAKLFGIAKDETLGWASAVANLGIQEELAGTALQNLFIKSMPAFIKGNKTLQNVTGKTARELKQAWKQDAGGALQAFIQDLSELSEGDRLAAIQKLYGKGSGLTRVLLGLTGDMDNLTESLDTGTKAWEDASAAQAEADKRFATSEFAFKRLNNSVNLAAATIGTELLPVLVDLAEEGMAWLNEPATQKAIKAFAVDLGKGLRGLASTLKGIDWSGFASALGIAAEAGKTLVQAFLGMPSWVQAAVLTGWGLNKVTGGLVGDLASGLIKGVLGINAGVVNLKAASVVGGGAGAGAAGGAGKFMSAVRILGAVTIAGASLIALAEVFKGFAEGVGQNQKDLLEKVDATNKQGFKDTVANLEATSKGLGKLQGLDRLLAEGFGGSEIAKNFEMAAGRITTELSKGNLDRQEMAAALSALKSAQEQADSLNLETPELDAAINALTATLKKPVKPPPPSKPPAGHGVAAKPGDNVFKQLVAQQNKQKAAIDAVKTQGQQAAAAQREKLAAINTSVATQGEQQRAALIAQTAVNVAGNLGAVVQSASQVLAAAATTAAARTAGTTAASASRTAGATAAAASSSGASRIVAAIWAARPIIQPTTIIERQTVSERGGATSDSRTRGR